MRNFLFLALVALALPLNAQAQNREIDNEAAITGEQAQRAADLPATLVVRVNEATKAVEVLHTNDKLPAGEATTAAIAKRKFTAMDPNGKMAGELDRDSSSSSWYFCFDRGNYYYPTYNYYGYNYSYTNYYSYNWRGYSYYYYNWSYRYW